MSFLPRLAALALLGSSTLIAQDLRFVAMDYAFKTPQQARPGVNRITFVNEGKEVHHMLVMLLPDSLDASQAFRRIASRQPIPGSRLVGGPAAIASGDSSVAWATLEPGRYLVICFIAASDHVPHAMKGMFGQVEVAGERLATTAPRADVRVTTTEYGFDLSQPIRAGATLIELQNDGAHDHDLQFIQLADSGSALAVARTLGSGVIPDGVRIAGGISSVASKGRAWGQVTLSPGRYALACFESDPTRRGPHYLHGMIQEIVVR